MAFRILFDVNIWIDFLDKERTGHQNAFRLFDSIISAGGVICATDTCIATTIYVLQRSRVAMPDIRMKWMDLLTVVDVVSTDAATAFQVFASNPPDLEDALLYAASITNQLSGIATNDPKFIAEYPQICLTPEQWLQQLDAASPSQSNNT